MVGSAPWCGKLTDRLLSGVAHGKRLHRLPPHRRGGPHPGGPPSDRAAVGPRSFQIVPEFANFAEHFAENWPCEPDLAKFAQINRCRVNFRSAHKLSSQARLNLSLLHPEAQERKSGPARNLPPPPSNLSRPQLCPSLAESGRTRAEMEEFGRKPAQQKKSPTRLRHQARGLSGNPMEPPNSTPSAI